MLIKLITSAFNYAKLANSELQKQWVTASFRIGSKLHETLLMGSVQQCGDIDILLRSLEDEFPKAKDSDLEAFHYQSFLSDLWIGQAYEICRTLLESGSAPDNDDFRRLAHELRLIRIGIEKHQIAQDRKLDAPLLMKRIPEREGDVVYAYVKDDPFRSHILPTGLSDRCSKMWQVIDLVAVKPDFWIERRDLSERMLAVFTQSVETPES